MKSLKVSLFTLIIAATANCASLFVSVIEQTSTTATIQGIGVSPADAKAKAEGKAREIFPKFSYSKDGLCTQEFTASQNGASTYWACTIYIKKD
ncbi:hypothetical protein EHQ61_12270 [Leptospira wolffii]|uniref:hypothetical protein n=1 Tax=Leptospira wolffii TaxID=409998 RepID=UPI0010833017|nr:hypothetical protein [Leptospira wolffii]TGL49233.1 hypothetical protein EHQ61_12270 [Leptospira wolffii]